MESLINAASVAFQFLQEGFYINLNWLGQFVRIIIEGVGIVGVGVIVFTLILKAITTPFDVYQRITMRKQSLIMRGMQDDLDKLKKQYANDKNMYNQKMMELQKKNGYNIFGSCLPMILSIVILIVAVTAFNSYSQYANLSMYESMAHEYNAAILTYAADGADYRLEGAEDGERPVLQSRDPFTVDGITYTYFQDNGINRLRVEAEADDKYLFYTYSLDDTAVKREYQINVDKLYVNQKDDEVKGKIQTYIDADTDENKSEETKAQGACVQYFRDVGASVAAKWFRTENNPGFLWIKNVWYPDVSYSHPIQNYASFSKSFSKKIMSENWEGERSISDVFSESEYELLTSHLVEEKSQPNGYYILIILTIGLMVLSQFISMRSQKETNQYQTLDGQGARTQKIMMIMMPLIYAITGFMWTAAFSIYIAVGSIISIFVTLFTNLIIGRKFKKKEEEQIRQKYTRTLPWQNNSENTKKKK